MKGSEHCQIQLDSSHKKREKQKTKRRSKAGSTNANQYDDFLQKDLHNTSPSSMQTLEQIIFACSNYTTVEKRDVHDIAPWGRCNFHMLLSQRSQRRPLPANGAQQWHLTTWHPAMAPDHGTQQWHHAQSVKACHNHSPPLASSNGSSNGTQHPAMASYHMAPPPWHPAMAPYHGTQQWHHVQSIASSNGTQQWHLTTWHPAMASM